MNGLSSLPQGGRIDIRARRLNDELIVEVNGRTANASTRHHGGGSGAESASFVPPTDQALRGGAKPGRSRRIWATPAPYTYRHGGGEGKGG